MCSNNEETVIDTSRLELKLEEVIENIRQIGIMVEDFQPQAQQVFNSKIQRMRDDLAEIEQLKGHLNDFKVPHDLCDYIDAGGNPQMYTRERLAETKKKNEDVNGKIEGFKKLKAKLLVELNKHFPAEIEKYRAIRRDSVGSSSSQP